MWEVVKMLSENPQLTFKLSQATDTTLRVNEIGLLVDSNDNCINIPVNTKWTLEQQPVSFMEAIKTFREGKEIYCKLDKYTYTFRTGFMELKDVDGNPITPREIVDGKWFIKEGE